MCAKSLWLYPTLCDSMDYSPPGSSVHGILQAGILEWIAIASSRDLPDPGVNPAPLIAPTLVGGFFITSATWEVLVAPFSCFFNKRLCSLILCQTLQIM